MSFCHLHVHSIFSQLDGISSSEDYAKKAAEYGHKHLAVTDHGRLSAILEHQKSCLRHNIHPILGVEMYLCDILEEYDSKKKRIRTKNNHIILLVKNKDGYDSLLRLNYLSMDDEHFYYNPRITTQELFKYSKGLVVGTACLANKVSEHIIKGNLETAEEVYKSYLEVFKDDFFTEIQINEMVNEIGEAKEGQKTVNSVMIDLANKYSVPIVITGDVHYLEDWQHKLQTLAIAIRDKTTIDNIKFELESKMLYYHDVKDYIKFNDEYKYGYSHNDIINWCNNAVNMAEKCSFVIPERNRIYLPKYTDDDDKELILQSKKGLQERFKLDKYEDIPKEYRDRLNTELEVIIRKGFSSYCLLIKDIADFSIRENIYGRFGRGSSSGSLVLYSLRIHNIDPIEQGLLFERFLSDQRTSDISLNYFNE